MRYIFLLCFLVFLLFLSQLFCEAATEKTVTDDGVVIEVSSAPNPAWTPEKLIDGKMGAAEGWLARTDEEKIWLRFSFPSKQQIRGIVFYQISFSEAGANRYARPKTISVKFGDGAPQKIALNDAEGKPQVWEFTPVQTSDVTIDILDLYTDARYPEYTGFQEIAVVPSDERIPPDAQAIEAVEEQVNTPSTGENKGLFDEVKKEIDEGVLDAEEEELLRLLHEFTEKFERYLRKKAKIKP